MDRLFAFLPSRARESKMKSVVRFCAALALAGLASGVLLHAQLQLPAEPPKQFGSGVTGAFEGWFDNPDGSHNFLVGYLNRNRAQAVDIPIGPNNRIEPGGPDMGQPTHFLPGRNVGMFMVTVPKEFTPQQRLTWTLTINGQTNQIPLRLHTDYNVSPLKIEHGGEFSDSPPILRFEERGTTQFQGPLATLNKLAFSRTTPLATPFVVNFWAEDDAKFSSGTNAPMRKPPPPVTMIWSMFRGPGKVTFDKEKPTLETLKGGNVGQPYLGKGAVTAKFSEAGDYMLHVTVNDYTGDGGGGEVCCWTTALMKVTVTP
jgi:hypothetical protein